MPPACIPGPSIHSPSLSTRYSSPPPPVCDAELLKASRNLSFFTSFYRYLIAILPAAVVAPLYFRGEIEFGVINQSSSGEWGVEGGWGTLRGTHRPWGGGGSLAPRAPRWSAECRWDCRHLHLLASAAFSHILGDVSLVVFQFEAIAGFSGELSLSPPPPRGGVVWQGAGRGGRSRRAGAAAVDVSDSTGIKQLTTPAPPAPRRSCGGPTGRVHGSAGGMSVWGHRYRGPHRRAILHLLVVRLQLRGRGGRRRQGQGHGQQR